MVFPNTKNLWKIRQLKLRNCLVSLSIVRVGLHFPQCTWINWLMLIYPPRWNAFDTWNWTFTTLFSWNKSRLNLIDSTTYIAKSDSCCDWLCPPSGRRVTSFPPGSASKCLGAPSLMGSDSWSLRCKFTKWPQRGEASLRKRWKGIMGVPPEFLPGFQEDKLTAGNLRSTDWGVLYS